MSCRALIWHGRTRTGARLSAVFLYPSAANYRVAGGVGALNAAGARHFRGVPPVGVRGGDRCNEHLAFAVAHGARRNVGGAGAPVAVVHRFDVIESVVTALAALRVHVPNPLPVCLLMNRWSASAFHVTVLPSG